MTTKAKTVLITGATDGVGRYVAERLAAQGWRVIVHGRDRTRGGRISNSWLRRNRPSRFRPPNKFKENQGKPREKAWISLESFGRIGTFQRVTANPNKKIL